MYILETGGGPCLTPSLHKKLQKEDKCKGIARLKRNEEESSLEQIKKEARGSKEAFEENIGDSWKKYSPYGKVILL